MRRLWLAIALALSAVVSAHGQSVSDDSGKSVASANRAGEPKSAASAASAGLAGAVKTDTAEPKTCDSSNSSNRECRDLHAQEDMALWAKAMFFAALASGGIGIVGVYLVHRTLKETRIAANAAQAQLRIADEAHTAANRPRIVIHNVHIWAKGDGRGPLNSANPPPRLRADDEIEGTAFAVNMGGNPALKIESDCRIIWRDRPLSMTHPLWSWERGNPLWQYEIKDDCPVLRSKGANTDMPELGSGRWELSSVAPPNMREDLYVIGCVRYRDALNRLYETYFARKYNRSSDRFEAVDDSNYERET